MRVVIADDNTIVREGLAALLRGRGHDVVAALEDGDGVLAALGSAAVDVVVADIRMPPTHTDEGVRAAVRIKSGRPDVGVLLFSQYAEVQWASAVQPATRCTRRRCDDRLSRASSNGSGGTAR